MSATDDARSPLPIRRTLALLFAALAGAVFGAGAALLALPDDLPLFEARTAWETTPPLAGEWPRAPRAGESATVEGGRSPMLLVRAPRAPRVHELASAFASRHAAGLRGLLAAGDALEAAASAPGVEPAPPATPRSRTVSLLLAVARTRRDAVGALPPEWRAGGTFVPEPPAALAGADAEVMRAASAVDPVALEPALVAQADEEDAWLATGVPSPVSPLAERAGAWRGRQLAGADSLERVAAVLLQSVPRRHREATVVAAAAVQRELASRMPRPYAALLRSLPSAPEPLVEPITRTWVRWLGLGAALGAISGLLACAAGLALRRRPRAVPMLPALRRDPGARGAWLHLVAGPSPAAVARAAVELAAHALARGERVLVVDGGPRMRLHERFGREARWGLMECLLADMPVLGLVQYGGRPGFYLLAHGNATRGEGWSALGQRLDDARLHFGRIVLAVDATAPHALGAALTGRLLEGWWAGSPKRLPAVAIALSDRLGIPLSSIDLGAVSDGSLEELGGRTTALSRVPVLVHTPVIASVRAPEPEPLPLAPPQPIVMDCDLQVRQRLRFLAWMRRVQAERRRVAAESIS